MDRIQSENIAGVVFLRTAYNAKLLISSQIQNPVVKSYITNRYVQNAKNTRLAPTHPTNTRVMGGCQCPPEAPWVGG